MTGEDADVVAFENPVTDGEDDGAAKSAAPADGAAAAIQHDGSWEGALTFGIEQYESRGEGDASPPVPTSVWANPK